MRRLLASVLTAPLLLLAACSSADSGSVTAPSSGSSDTVAVAATQAPPAVPLDLNGDWVQTNSNSESSYRAGKISDGQIVINSLSEAESTRALYWAGTYVDPTEDAESYTTAIMQLHSSCTCV